MTDPAHENSAAGLVNEVLADVNRLIRGEVALARAEAEESLRDMVKGVVHLLIAAVFALVALNVLAGMLVMLLVWLGAGPILASLLVGVALLLVAAGLTVFGLQRLRLESLVPDRFLKNLRRDKRTLQTAVKSDATT